LLKVVKELEKGTGSPPLFLEWGACPLLIITAAVININDNFSLVNFYKTEGTVIDPFINITKLPDVPSLTIRDGQMVALNGAIYLFGSDGEMFVYTREENVWKTQTSNLPLGNTEPLLATSDRESSVYLSFDNGSFFKYDELNLTFKTLVRRPSGNQWLLTAF